MKVIIPVAGVGSRMKPHTFSNPKQLLEVAGKSMISYIVDEILKTKPHEIVFVVGHKKEDMIEWANGYLKGQNISFVEQEERNGDGGAIKLALDELNQREAEDDEVVVIFGDTVIDFNINEGVRKCKNNDGVVFTKRVEAPQNYGVVNTDENNLITDVEEKPEFPATDLAVIGAYCFGSFKKLSSYINRIFQENITSKGEYRLADAIQLMVQDKEAGNKVTQLPVDGWFDCGRPAVLLNANQYFLEKNGKSTATIRGDSVVNGPAYVSKDAVIEKSVIGPYTSIGAGVVVENSVIENSIIGRNTVVKDAILKDSIIGSDVNIKGNKKKLNIGDKSEFIFE